MKWTRLFDFSDRNVPVLCCMLHSPVAIVPGCAAVVLLPHSSSAQHWWTPHRPQFECLHWGRPGTDPWSAGAAACLSVDTGANAGHHVVRARLEEHVKTSWHLVLNGSFVERAAWPLHHFPKQRPSARPGEALRQVWRRNPFTLSQVYVCVRF